MGVKKLVAKTVKHARRKHQDFVEYEKVGTVTDDKLRRESMGLITDLKMVDSDYVKFVKRYSKFGKDGGKSEYNKKMLEKARTERVRAQIKRYQESLAKGVSGMAVARIVGHVAINAVFNKQFRNDFLDQFRKPIEKTAHKLANARGQASMSGRYLSGDTHVPFDARSAALTELAQTAKFNEDMRNTKDPAKREWLTKSYSESLNALYEWAGQDGVSADSIRRMRNVILDKDLNSKRPKFAHLYEGSEFIQRDSQRVEFFKHLNEGVGVWEGDFKDSRTGGKFQMIVHVPEYGEKIHESIDLNIDTGIDVYADDHSVVEDAMVISKMEAEGYQFEERELEDDFEPERIQSETTEATESYVVEDDKIVENNEVKPNEIVLDWSEFEEKAVPVGKIDFEAEEKPTPSLEIGTWDDVKREVLKRRIPDLIANDVVEERFSTTIEKASWERMVDSLTNEAEKPMTKINSYYNYGGGQGISFEQLKRQAEFELIDSKTNGHVSKSLQIVPEAKDVSNGYNRIDFDTQNNSININYITRERTRRQELSIAFEETKEAMMAKAKKTPSITDDQLISKLELNLAEAGLGATLREDMKDYQIGD